MLVRNYGNYLLRPVDVVNSRISWDLMTLTRKVYYCISSQHIGTLPALLGLAGRELARQTSEPSSNPSWDATVHPVCETFNLIRVI